MIAPEGTHPRVLIVEDDRATAEELRAAISDVAQGDIWSGKGMRSGELSGYDGLILDLRLGELTGIDALQAMDAQGGCPWIVLVSGAEPRLVRHFADVARSKGFRIVDQFAKPVDVDRLRAALAGGHEPARPASALVAEMNTREIVAGFYAGALDIHFQPILRADTGRCRSAEALVRWTAPSPVAVPSAPRIIEAIIAENIEDVFDGWLVERCARAAIEFRQKLGPFRVSLNIASARIADKALLKTLSMAAGRVNRAGGRLCVEITEQGPSEISADTGEAVAALRLANCDVALDDYGTGVSNFDRIGHLAVSELKIDRTLLDEARRSPAAVTHLSGLIQFCHERGVDVVQEGIETDADAAIARRIGADLLQGFLYSKPLPRTEFIEWCERRAKQCDRD